MDKIEEVLTRGVANIIPSKKELEKNAVNELQLNIYLGIDPTSTKIHLGHAVPLRKLKQFTELGHNVTFLIGDFTALIGDTSDKESERPVLTKEEIEKNFQTYKKQAEKILDFTKVTVRRNSEWLGKLTFEDVVKLTQNFSLGDFIGRELISKRIKEGKRIGLHEVLYPVMQGYDSYMMDTDIQVGGTDQTFNMQAGRTLNKNWRNKESFVLTTPILEGTDGRKMSKTFGNSIWLEDEANDIYAKVMAINDELIIEYFTLATNISIEEIEEIKKEVKNDPMEVKKRLAFIITEELHSKEAAKKAEEHFQKTVQQKELPDEIEEKNVSSFLGGVLTASEVLTTIVGVSSKSEAKRLIEQGGLTIDGEPIKDPNKIVDLEGEHLLKTGKRKFLKTKTN
ncbi:MAG: tyrosine--tRNA ligase [Actinobacteria bacterium]|nr:tyrosine--tRNA ligase [Actinomycetota bacterium]